jgi:four helix bundle protein
MEGIAMRLHKNLDVWRDSVTLAATVYKLTEIFPAEEKFGLISQMRRAAVSVSSNIAEGAARQTKKEYIQFLYIASGSASELDTQLHISEEVGFVKSEQVKTLRDSIDSVSRMLQGLIRSLKGRE